MSHSQGHMKAPISLSNQKVSISCCPQIGFQASAAPKYPACRGCNCWIFRFLSRSCFVLRVSETKLKLGRRDRCERLGVQAGTDQRAGRHWWREFRLSAAESCLQATAPTSASTGPSASQSRSVFPQTQNMFFFQFESILKCYGKSIWEITQQMLLKTKKLPAKMCLGLKSFPAAPKMCKKKVFQQQPCVRIAPLLQEQGQQLCRKTF